MNTSKITWNSLMIGAAFLAAYGIYMGYFNEISILGWDSSGEPFFRYSCGAPFNPEYPVDGNGPCTPKIQTWRLVAGGSLIAAAILGWIGYKRAANERDAIDRRNREYQQQKQG